MNIKKSLLVAGVVTTLGATGIAGTSIASAATPTEFGMNDSSSSLITRIAKRFNLKQSEVKKVFDQDHQTHMKEAEARFKSKLNTAVKQGKLTSSQRSKILAKNAELKKNMEAMHKTMKNKTEAQRHALMQKQRTSLQKWATQNKIPAAYFHFVMGGGHHAVNMKFVADRR